MRTLPKVTRATRVLFGKRLLLPKGLQLLSVISIRMQQLSSLLPKVLAKRGLAEHAHAAHVVHASEQWLLERLPDFRGVLKVQKFQDGTIFVSCTHSIAAQECHPLFSDLQVFLHKECRFNDIKGVRLTRS